MTVTTRIGSNLTNTAPEQISKVIKVGDRAQPSVRVKQLNLYSDSEE